MSTREAPVYSRPSLSLRTIVAAVPLAVYAVAWGWTALGRGVPGMDDHAGQLYRLIHAITRGPAPWHWNPGWWAGYPELQYYPPLFFHVGYAFHWLALGLATPGTLYLILVWLVFLLPAATTYTLLVRALGSGWAALPAAFLALVMSAGSRSGAEEGLRWGLVAARLGWGLLPLLALALLPWLEGRARPRAVPALLVAAVILAHPAHGAMALVLVALAGALAPGPWRRTLGAAAVVIALGLGLAAFWLLPLVTHLVVGPPMALALAWADASLAGLAVAFASRPLLLLLLALSLAGGLAIAMGIRPARPLLWLQTLPAVIMAVTLLDAVFTEPTGLHWLPADRLMDSVILALLLGGSASVTSVLRAGLARYGWDPPWAAAGIAITLGLAAGVFLSGPTAASREPTVSLWPRVRDWPTLESVIHGYRFDALWDALRRAPPGRVLFLRSSVPLEFGQDWWREHSHLPALTPVMAERGIIGGTFTHPSPVAGYFYAGLREGPAALLLPIRRLAEQLDSVSLFGRDLDRLQPGELSRLLARLGVSTVVALDEDTPRLSFLTAEPAWAGPTHVGPFLLFIRPPPGPLARAVGSDRYVVLLASPVAGWVSTGVAWSPLWRARGPGGSLATRQGELGLLEVELPASPAVEVRLHHEPGLAEWVGALVSLAAAGVILLGRGGLDRRLG
jgi:hypothetical protein